MKPFEIVTFHDKIQGLPFDDYFRLIAMMTAVHTGMSESCPEAKTLIEGIEAYADILLVLRGLAGEGADQ